MDGGDTRALEAAYGPGHVDADPEAGFGIGNAGDRNLVRDVFRCLHHL